MLTIAAAVLLGVTAQPAVAAAKPADAGRAVVSGELLNKFNTTNTTPFLVYLREQAELSGAAQAGDADAQATEVYHRLTGTATRTQRGLRAELDRRGVKYTAFWIANALWVQGDKALVEEIAARSDVARIEPSRSYRLVEPERGKATTKAGTHAIEWGLNNIEAPRVWSEFGVRGEGLVIASIDTGVQFDHPALVGKYRGNLGNGTFDHNYNWFDPAGICPSAAPCDNNDHGTHTVGTMVGDDGAGNQIGVAPAAKWIAAKGCETNNCTDASLLAAGQWVLAPTDLNGENPRPDLHADIVNNSWGGGQNDLWYQQTVRAWRAAGMFPTFSAGNDGPGCGTANSPGDYPESYAVGSYNINNNIATTSSRGASRVDGSIKPNIAAPGAGVRSSVPDDAYATFSGTSMAAPHVSGTVALVWSAAPSLRGDVTATEQLLDSTATDVNSLGCGGTVEKNNNFGEGRLNAYQAVNAAPRGPVGRIVGTVTDAADGAPIAGATVVTGSRTAVTDPDGSYVLTVEAGEHEVTVDAYGYASQTETVTVAEGSAADLDFALVAESLVTVSGTVTDGSGHGWPLYAKIEVAGRPGDPIFTNPVNGRYSFTVPGNTAYRLTVTVQYPGYRTVTTAVELDSTAKKKLDISVPVDPACTVVGYSGSLSEPLLSETFDTADAPEGWSVVNRTASGGWTFTDVKNRGNLTGGTGGFAIIDSDALGSGNTQDTDLITPVVDLSAASAPLLRFNSDWRAVGISDTADVDVSTDGGDTWTNVWHQTSSRRGPRVEEIPLTAAAGAAEARIRFRFNGTFAWWWEVDNVQVVNRVCAPVPGGLVTGFVTDYNTGAPLNGVKVASHHEPLDSGVSAATPDDPNIPDGFYWLFSSLTGSHPFTAAKSPYKAVEKSIDVVADGTVRSNFKLRAGRLTVGPTSIVAHQRHGATRTAKVTVTNTGSAPATVEALERDGGVELLSERGAPLVEQVVKGISKAATGTAYGAIGAPGTSGATPLVDDAWTRVANLPATVFDNAAATLGGKVYSVGGGTGSGNERKAWVYDPETNAWSTLPDLPSPRSKPSAAAVNGKLYVLGGWGPGGTPVATVDVFDPATETWSTLPEVTNPAARSAAGTAVVNGKVYLVGGCVDASCADTDNLVIFDPQRNTFSTGANYPQPVSWLSCGGIGDAVYCAGGAGATEFRNGFVYRPSADVWEPIPDLPVDLWASQYTTAGGMLVLAGGVTAGSTVITNRTVGYDPAAGAWRDLPNAAFARFRGAGACGAYKIGGSPTSFVGSAETERLGGLENCDEAGDAPWLSTDPASFTLAPGASRTVTVTLTATPEAGVNQPGTYSGQLAFASNTPYPVDAVDVEMNVSPPASWGKLQGKVQGRSCSGELVPIRATIRVGLVSDPGSGVTLSTDSQGRYAYWLPRGRYEVIVAKDGWTPQAQRIQLPPGLESTLDFTLAPVTPCASGI